MPPRPIESLAEQRKLVLDQLSLHPEGMTVSALARAVPDLTEAQVYSALLTLERNNLAETRWAPLAPGLNERGEDTLGLDQMGHV